MKRFHFLIKIAAVISVYVMSPGIQAGQVNIPNEFAADTPAVAAEVNENFDALETEVNDNDSRIIQNDSDNDALETEVNDNDSDIADLQEALAQRVYGDGSQGDLDMPNLTVAMPSNTRQFADCIIRAGFTLTVDSGTVIRCNGGFTNEGTIIVETYAKGGSISCTRARRPAHPGHSGSVAGFPACNDAYRNGAQGTFGIERPRTAANLLQPGPLGGGGGSGPIGADGGGTLTIIAKGPISNTGEIRADGQSGTNGGSGGGAGGIVILASGDSIVNSGTISVRGGDGASATAADRVGPGGGGGGGIVHLISPAILQGTIDVAEGAGGTGGETLSSLVNDTILPGGGAGGACYGGGGAGGDIDGYGELLDAHDGNDGAAFTTLADPQFFF